MIKNPRSLLKQYTQRLRKKPDRLKALFTPLLHWKIIVITSFVLMILVTASAVTVFTLYGDLSISVAPDVPSPLLDRSELEEALSEYLEKEAQFQQLQDDPPEFIEP